MDGPVRMGRGWRMWRHLSSETRTRSASETMNPFRASCVCVCRLFSPRAARFIRFFHSPGRPASGEKAQNSREYSRIFQKVPEGSRNRPRIGWNRGLWNHQGPGGCVASLIASFHHIFLHSLCFRPGCPLTVANRINNAN